MKYPVEYLSRTKPALYRIVQGGIRDSIEVKTPEI